MSLDMQRAEPGKHASAVLSAAVHVFLAAFLIYGIQWQTAPQEAVEVDLVRAVPAPEPARVQQPAPEPRPETKPEPVPKQEAKPEPKPAPILKQQPALPKPDIAVKGKPAFDPKTMQHDSDRLAQQLQRDSERLAQQQQAAALDRELARLKTSSASNAWADKIRAKIRGNIRRPSNIEGNPEAVYIIHLLPDGSVVGDPQKETSTGNPALDSAIERAILQSSPLPRPDDPSVFQRDLRLTFRPMED